MRLISVLVVMLTCGLVFAQENSASELAKVQAELAAARQAAAADPSIKDAQSAPVRAYLSLRQRIEQAQGDQSKESLLQVWKEQLADLESRPLERVYFDSASGYKPTTGLVAYSKKVRLLENTSDGQSLIEMSGDTPVLLSDLETSQYPSGKFLSIPKAVLIGPQAPDQTVRGVKKKAFTATLVDLEAVLSAHTGAAP
jgi:hypothetical protein